MALEILLEKGKDFYHDLRHDLESVLYVIIWTCTHMTGPGEERSDVQDLYVRQWCEMSPDMAALGHRKLAHMADPKRTLFGQITPYWQDFIPVVHELIQTSFVDGYGEPNTISSKKMGGILKAAQTTIKEPSEADLTFGAAGKRNREGGAATRPTKRPKTVLPLSP